MADFIFDIEQIRREARKHIEAGPVTEHYRADKAKVIELLSAALATEWICVLRYTQHRIVAEGIHSESVSKHFAEHAAEEQGHAMQLAERIKQLGGHPSLDPSTLKGKSHAEYRECDSLFDMIKENLIAERIAVASYTEMIRFIGDRDPTTRTMLEGILATEEEHADEMADLLVAHDPREDAEKGPVN